MVQKKQFNYAEAQAELQTILDDLQTGDLDVDAASKQYERGLDLVKELEDYLKTAEHNITQLKAKRAE